MPERTIWKFTIPIQDSVELKMEGATLVKILHADVQNALGADPFGEERKITLWAIVDPHPDSVQWVPIEIRGTGHPLREGPIFGDAAEQHIATVQDGPFVWHLFHGKILS
ncbi:hypothetical protein SEA_BIPAUNETO_72 [Gordonia phage BiPauneto]|nr:hypothetical protein SEA_BIPAUNETO_72 [Gordonia phage BiPauneto]